MNDPIEPGAGAAEAGAADAPRRVLLADNDVHVAAVLEAFLRRAGLEVEVVGDGGTARDRLRSADYDLLVCDLDMPVLSGDALLAEIGADPRAPPVMVVSGYVDEGTVERLAAQPAVRAVLRKPFDLRAFARQAAEIARGGPGLPPVGPPASLF
jgi:CheY-like chemotaxis protein